MSDSFKLVTEYGLSIYPCGIRSGDKLLLKNDFIIRDHQNKPTGEIYPRGQIWTVLSGVIDEPEVIWLRQPDGERHTWDAESLFEAFDKAASNSAEQDAAANS